MEENPSVKIVLDVHRDAIEQSDGTRIKPTTTVNGRKAAQIMIIAGCEDGKVTSFPTWGAKSHIRAKVAADSRNHVSGAYAADIVFRKKIQYGRNAVLGAA